jgi:hypothetical protein
MKISLERSGGFAGMHLASSVDTTLLTKDESEKLEEIVKDSDFFNCVTDDISKPKAHPDAFKYKITVETLEKRHSIEADDMTMPKSLRPLVQIMLDKARQVKQ